MRLQEEVQASMQQLQTQIAEKEAALAAVTKVRAGCRLLCLCPTTSHTTLLLQMQCMREERSPSRVRARRVAPHHNNIPPVLLQERDALQETLEAERRNNAVEREGLQRAAATAEQVAQQASAKVGPSSGPGVLPALQSGCAGHSLQ